MSVENLKTLITVLSSVCAIVFGCVALMRNKKSDDTSSARNSAVLSSDVGYIKAGVDDIKQKQAKQDERYIVTVQKLSENEQSIKSAHKRIDTVEQEVNEIRKEVVK